MSQEPDVGLRAVSVAIGLLILFAVVCAGIIGCILIASWVV